MPHEHGMTSSSRVKTLLVRPLMLAAICAVLWGTLLLGALLWHAVDEGPAVAVALWRPPAQGGIWSWLNAALPAAALLVWSVLAAGLWQHRRRS
jgi:hypothetical protein